MLLLLPDAESTRSTREEDANGIEYGTLKLALEPANGFRSRVP